MQVTLDFKNGFCHVHRDNDDKRVSGGSWGTPESNLLYRVQQELKKQGYDVIKKRMWKDGHLVDDHLLYIRTRKYMETPEKTDREFAIWNSWYQVVDAGMEYERQGFFDLDLEE